MPDPRMPRAPGNREQMSGYGEKPPNEKPLPHVGAGVNPTDAGGAKTAKGQPGFRTNRLFPINAPRAHPPRQEAR